MGHASRREELGGFLRKRRMTLRPEQVGLAPGARRRTPGLRREEVAQAAHVSAGYYTFLEQGRDIRVSAEVLQNISRALQLDQDEAQYVFDLAEVPAPQAPPPAHETVPEGLQAMLDAWGYLPAYVYGRMTDRLAWNRAADVAFRMGESGRDTNLAWRVFTDPNRRKFIGNWEAVARGQIASLRLSYARWYGDPAFEKLIADLEQTSPEFREWWADQEVGLRGYGLVDAHHPVMGALHLARVGFTLEDNADLHVSVFRPRDDATRRKLETLLEADA